MPGFFDSKFRSPPVSEPRFTDVGNNFGRRILGPPVAQGREIPIGQRPPINPFLGPPESQGREIPIGQRPPGGVPFLGPPLSGPRLNPMQRIAAIFRNAAGNPGLVNQLRRSQSPLMQRAIANRGLFRRF